jgi:hypothetical protein
MVLELRKAVKTNFKELATLWTVYSREIDYPDKERALETYAHESDIYIN